MSQAACLEDLDWQVNRGMEKSLFLKLASCEWLHSHLNVIITGPTGVGKSYVALCVSAKSLPGRIYYRIPENAKILSGTGAGQRGMGVTTKLLLRLAKTDLLILDDWGLAPFTDEGRRDLLEILEDRHSKKSTLITSQIPIAKWHEVIGNPTLADAIMDRLVHNAYQITLKGESMRKQKNTMLS